ncbi:transketolase family protein [Tannerella forsythia]|uniref:transketolase n=1 Tax=Tannerella forsythia TaxID=28112 RepID=A0A3P1XWR9_TANFO|nr:transketolase [Tannerella forsythia]RRD63149.1 transketolase [Tannerella forsythia]
MNEIKNMNRAADNIRILAASMVEKAKSGHPGGAMGGADFVNVLFAEFLNYNPDQPDYPYRDRFFLDPGHMSPMLYGVLALAGLMPAAELENFRQWGSQTPGHPEVDVLHGIENTSGPLGQGHAMALGAAIAERFMTARFGEWMAHKTYVYISDGGIQEEVSQGVGRVAGHLGLHNFIMYYDANNIQLSTKVDEVTSEDIAAKYRAWNWNVLSIDGCSVEEIREALQAANKEKERPTLIIGRTVMGKGAVDAKGASYEDKVSTHGQPLSAAGADIDATIRNLGGDPKKPFAIFPEVQKMYADRKKTLRTWFLAQQKNEEKFRKGHPELSAKLDLFLSGKLPKINYSSIKMKEHIATRAASSTMLGLYAQQVENMVVASADLSNSDKTDGFLKHTHAFRKGDFSGQFLQMGVSELTMACIMNGMALHGGIIPVCGTFFVFSDYMKPAVRLAALMRLHVIYVWTHDSFRVGEDGPTHQPVEHEAQLRLLEHLHNHKSKRSMVVLRPADAEETIYAWKIALEENRPTALVLSRQDIVNLPAASGNRRKEARQIVKGGYIVSDCEGQPDVVMLASGSEVATLVEGAAKLTKAGVKTRVVSVPSEGLFRDQKADYQEHVLPKGVRRFGLTSGLPVTLQGLVGDNGVVHGLPEFGYSAPYKVLDKKLGYTGENVCRLVKKMLNK